MLQPGAPAPDFDLASLDGRRYHLADALTSGPVLAAFFKSACRTSDLLFRYLPRFAETYPEVAVWAISQDDIDETAGFARERGLSLPVLLDGDGMGVSRAYDPDATPTFFLIGRDGCIEQVSVAFSKDELNQAAERVATAVGRAATVLATPDDGNPPFRPG